MIGDAVPAFRDRRRHRPGHTDRGRRHRRVQRPAPGRWSLGLRRRPRLARPGHRRRQPGREGDVHRRALRGVEGVSRRLLDHRGPRPGRGAHARQPRARRAATGRSRCGRSCDARARRWRGDHACPPRGVGAGGRLSDQALRRPRHRRGGGRRGVRDRRRAVAGRRRSSQPRRLADHHRHPQGHRPDPARAQARRQAGGGSDVARRRPTRASRRHRRRPAPADLHLLSPGARDGDPRGADAADGRRADRARDRPRLPDAGDRHGAADHPREGQDQGGPHPVPGAVGGGSPGTRLGRARRPLPRLQRGLPGERPRHRSRPSRPDRRGDPAHAPGPCPHAGGR